MFISHIDKDGERLDSAGLGVSSDDLRSNFCAYKALVNRVNYEDNTVDVTIYETAEQLTDVQFICQTDYDSYAALKYGGNIDKPGEEFFLSSTHVLLKEEDVIVYRHTTDITRNFAVPYAANGKDKWGNCTGTTYWVYGFLFIRFSSGPAGDKTVSDKVVVWDIEHNKPAEVVNSDDTGLIEFPCDYLDIRHWYETRFEPTEIGYSEKEVKSDNVTSSGIFRAPYSFWTKTFDNDTGGDGSFTRRWEGDIGIGDGAHAEYNFTRLDSAIVAYSSTETIDLNAVGKNSSTTDIGVDNIDITIYGEMPSLPGSAGNSGYGDWYLDTGLPNEPRISHSCTLSAVGEKLYSFCSYSTTVTIVFGEHEIVISRWNDGSTFETGGINLLQSRYGSFLEDTYKRSSLWMGYLQYAIGTGTGGCSEDLNTDDYKTLTIPYLYTNIGYPENDYSDFFTYNAQMSEWFQDLFYDFTMNNTGGAATITPQPVISGGVPVWMQDTLTMDGLKLMCVPFDKRVAKYL